MQGFIKTTSLLTIGVVISKVIKLNKTKYWIGNTQCKTFWITIFGKRIFTKHLPIHRRCN